MRVLRHSGDVEDHVARLKKRRRPLATVLMAGLVVWVLAVDAGGSVSVTSVGASAQSASTTPSTTADESSTTTTVAATTSTTTDIATPTTVVTDELRLPKIAVPDPVDVEGAAQRFCSLSTGYVDQVRRIEMSLTSPDQLRSLMDSAAPAAAESVGIAAKDVQGDAARVSGTLDELRAALEAADYELAELPPDMVTRLQSPPVQEALNRIEQFSEKGC